VIVPALFGSFASASGGIPSSVPTSTTISCTFSVTSPLPVEMPNPVLFSSTLTSFSWATVLALMNSCCTRGRVSRRATACCAGASSAPASGGPSRLRFGGSRCESACPTSMLSYSWLTM
jgi:hypothetical protein